MIAYIAKEILTRGMIGNVMNAYFYFPNQVQILLILKSPKNTQYWILR